MNFTLFSQLYSKAGDYSDVDMYIAECGCQDWIGAYHQENDEGCLDSMLRRIYSLYHCSIREIRESVKLSRVRFCQLYGIPARTEEDWESKRNKMPEYTKKLIAYTVFQDECESGIPE